MAQKLTSIVVVPCRVARRALRALHDDGGAASISFIIALPIFLTIVAILVQLGLMVNAKVVVAHAADTAARSAVTCLPEDRPEAVQQAAWLALASVSPISTAGTAVEADDMAEALGNAGVDVPSSLAGRISYAREATSVTWTPQRDFRRSAGGPIDVTVTYRFRLTVPVAMRIVPAMQETIAGVTGRFWEVSSTTRVEVSHGREARSDNTGWPN